MPILVHLTVFKALEAAYSRWHQDLQDLIALKPPSPDFIDDFLLAMMFPEQIGGTKDHEYPDQAILFPQKSIPKSWEDYAETGIIRIEVNVFNF